MSYAYPPEYLIITYSPVIAVKNIKVEQMENLFMLLFYSALKDARLFRSTKIN